MGMLQNLPENHIQTRNLKSDSLKVLNMVGLADTITKETPNIGELRDQTHSGEDIGVSDFPSKCIKKYGQPACGVRRTTITLLLRDTLLANDIPLHQNWKLVDIDEQDDKVVAISADGERVEGSFLIGCDGIKAASRTILLKKKGITEGDSEFTGLTQVGGLSPTPPCLENHPGMLNLYGPGSHFITYPMAPGTSGWAFTQRESEKAKETWRPYTDIELEEHKASLLKSYGHWSSPIPEMIRSSFRMLKFGIYDRPELAPENWYHNRCVLVGDAAHPTSPHLGQGANQAL